MLLAFSKGLVVIGYLLLCKNIVFKTCLTTGICIGRDYRLASLFYNYCNINQSLWWVTPKFSNADIILYISPVATEAWKLRKELPSLCSRKELGERTVGNGYSWQLANHVGLPQLLLSSDFNTSPSRRASVLNFQNSIAISLVQ